MKILTKSNKAILVGGKAIKDNGLTDTTKSLVAAITGVTPTDELSLNNGIAEGSTNGASEHSWADTRTTAGGGTITDGVAYVDKAKGKSIKLNQLANYYQSSGQGITITQVSDGYILTGTATNRCIFRFVDLTPFANGSKFCFVLNRTNTGIQLYETSNGAKTAVTEIYTKAANRQYGVSIAAGVTLNNEKITFACFSLTEMGIDNLTTADAVAQYLGYADAASMPYIPYTPSTTILHSQHSGIVSKDEDGQTLDTLTLPSLVLRGVGTAQDEYTPSTGKVTRKIASVDLGSLSWSAYTLAGHSSFLTSSLASVVKRVASTSEKANAIVPKYEVIARSTVAESTDKAVTFVASGNMYVIDSDYTSVNDFVNAMSGVILYYELATPTETSTEQQTPQRAYYKVSNNGQETANAVGQSAPFVADIGYKEATATQLMNVLTQ